MTDTAYTVTPKFNRCLSFTLPDGTVIDVKVLGTDKVVARVDMKRLLDILTAAASNTD
jgi:hypothetical protein